MIKQSFAKPINNWHNDYRCLESNCLKNSDFVTIFKAIGALCLLNFMIMQKWKICFGANKTLSFKLFGNKKGGYYATMQYFKNSFFKNLAKMCDNKLKEALYCYYKDTMVNFSYVLGF